LAGPPITSIGGLRFSIRASHGSTVELLCFSQRTAARVEDQQWLKVRSPMRDVAPSFCFPPLACCGGVRAREKSVYSARDKLRAEPR